MSERLGFRSWLRLQVGLSAIAFVVFLVRSAQTMNLLGPASPPLPWTTVLLTQGAFWVAWSLLAGAIVPLVHRIVERPAGRIASRAALVALALAPVVVVPALSVPAHKLALGDRQAWPATFQHIFAHQALTNLIIGVAVVGVAFGYLALRRTRRMELTTVRLHAQVAEAQLEALRAQLDPHFLFNALNSIAVLARRGQNAAVEGMVTRLAGLLRHSLDSRAQVVTLGVELAALRHYLEIEQVRFGPRLLATIDVPEELHGRLVPSFLLQPLAENAVRHGFADSETPLHLEVRARASGDRLQLVVTDDGIGLGGNGPARDGVGLGNTRARLAGLYGGAASLSVGSAPGGSGTRVEVTLPG